MRRALRDAGAADDLTGALSAGWYFGSAAMAAFGLVTIICGVRLKRHDRSGVAVVLVIAASYVLFGITTFVMGDFNPHSPLFIATGLLAGAPVLGRGEAGSSAAPSDRPPGSSTGVSS